MNADELRALIDGLAAGRIGTDEAMETLRGWPTDASATARLDLARPVRTGLPEAVYAEGKTRAQVRDLLRRIADRGGVALATRVPPEMARALVAELEGFEWDDVARMVWRAPEPKPAAGLVAVVAAGTSDLPVVREATRTLELLGSRFVEHVDVGVAALHRLVDCLPAIREARCVVVVAGMDGALPSVVSGLVDRPVVAVPTSIGYGASLSGLGPLLAMLGSCAPGMSVVNIDNGFGAACCAHRINVLASAERPW